MNEVKWSKKAKRQLAKISINYRMAITDATRALVNFPECKNVKPLKKYDFRLRVGRYRVFFDFDGQIKIIAIQEVKKRDERTY